MARADVKAAVIGGLASRANAEVMDAGRQVVIRSSTRWRRVTDGDPCGFCAMLAGRGPVYHSAQTAGEGRHFHRYTPEHGGGNCGCTVEPFEGDPDTWEPTPGEQRLKAAYDAVHQPGMSDWETGAKVQEWLADPANALQSARRSLDGFEDLPLIKGGGTVDEAVMGANPHFSTGNRDYTENCANTSTAFEVRMRGYDVTGAPHHDGKTMGEIMQAWRLPDGSMPERELLAGKGTRDIAAKAADADLPIGSRGVICGQWQSGGGHFWSWEKTKTGIVFYDAQKGKMDASTYLRLLKPGRIMWMRLDDCTFAGDLSEWLRWN